MRPKETKKTFKIKKRKTKKCFKCGNKQVTRHHTHGKRTTEDFSKEDSPLLQLFQKWLYNEDNYLQRFILKDHRVILLCKKCHKEFNDYVGKKAKTSQYFL